ncbi:hypothetical protein ENSA5_29710 [Enhygromyxa salina]|uniref:Uncharacterized protein n=1 Tax=Enhygromyxa salina TaxID=215803 RepID=A0A2S9Y0H0_9BACT|nr:hypothetical protein ENSA5_29710 [Enhygromyxa salina]
MQIYERLAQDHDRQRELAGQEATRLGARFEQRKGAEE